MTPYTPGSSYRYEYSGGGPGFVIGHMTRGVKILLIANLVVFLLQVLFDRNPHPFRPDPLSQVFGLMGYEFFRGHVYQVVTYMFLHDGVMHLVFNMLGLFFLGPETERGMGTRPFVVMYFLSGILGGLAWTLVPGSALCVGASGAVFGVICSFAALYPHRQITLLLMFILPVTMKAWVMAAGLMGIQLLFLVKHEGGNIAYMVHLAGGLAGWIYTTVAFRPELLTKLGLNPGQRPSGTRFGKRKSKSGEPTREEIDRLLDKIANEGIGSLKKSERELLQQASRKQTGR